MYPASVTSLAMSITFSRLSLSFIKKEWFLTEHQQQREVVLSPMDLRRFAPHHSGTHAFCLELQLLTCVV